MTKKTIKESEILVSQTFYNFFLFISFFNYFTLSFFILYFFYPRLSPTPTLTTHTHDPRLLPTTLTRLSLSLCLCLSLVERGLWWEGGKRGRETFPFPSPPATAARVTRRRLGTNQVLMSMFVFTDADSWDCVVVRGPPSAMREKRTARKVFWERTPGAGVNYTSI